VSFYTHHSSPLPSCIFQKFIRELAAFTTFLKSKSLTPDVTSLNDLSLILSVELIDKTDAPILVMHGTKDRVVPIVHAKELHKMARNPVNPLWLEGGGHDDLYAFDCYMKRLKRFVDSDLAPNK